MAIVTNNVEYVIAGFVFDYFIIILILLFGIRLVLDSKNKSMESSKAYTKGFGFFFIAMSLCLMIYGTDLLFRLLITGNRIFPADTEYQAMGYEFASLHLESYFLVIMIFILLALSALMNVIEKLMLNRKPILSKICLFLVPLPLIIRFAEMVILPQEGSVLYYVFTGLFVLIWLAVIASVFTMLGLYFKIVVKATGEVRKRSFSIIVATILWLAAIFTRSTLLKGIQEDPYTFWITPAIGLLTLLLYTYGFSENMEYSARKEGETHLYQNWFFKTFVTGFILAVAIYFSILLWETDAVVTEYWKAITVDNTFLDEFGNFMDDTGGLISYIPLAIFVLPYLLSIIIPSLKEKMEKKGILRYAGFLIAAAVAIMIVNRAFKGFFGRCRPGDIGQIEDGVLQFYTSVWTIGSNTLADGMSSGSFTSGHTTTAVIVLIFAFMLIKTGNKLLIITSLTLATVWTGLMGFGRVVHGSHYFGDVLWAGVIGAGIIAWIYFKVLDVPAQEEGRLKLHKPFAELRWALLFVFFGVGILAFAFGVKYVILDFEWYWVVAIIVGPILAYFLKKRMNFVLYGEKREYINE